MEVSESVEMLFSVVIKSSLFGAILIGIVILVQAIFRHRISPAWRRRFWFLVAVRLLLPVLPSSPTSVYNLVPSIGNLRPSGSVINHSLPGILPGRGSMDVGRFQAMPSTQKELDIVRITSAPSTRSITNPTAWEVAAWTWMLGVILMGFLFVMQGWRLRFISSVAELVDDERALKLLRESEQALNLQSVVQLKISREVSGPAVRGVLRPTILVPCDFINNLTNDELRHVFLHELAHIKQHDLILNWALIVATAIHWFNPVVWFAWLRMARDREVAADDLALLACGENSRKTYGTTVLKVVGDFSDVANRTLPGALGIGSGPKELRHRIRMISTFGRSQRGPVLALVLLGTIALFALTDAQLSGPNGGGTALEVAERERQADLENLEKIGRAIAAYRVDHGELPNWLSDLFPDYLIDTGILMSPVELRTGRSVLHGNEDPNIRTSYIYEFSGNLEPKFPVGSARMTKKQWKTRQMQDFGESVPIVRCLLHEPVLNLAYSGDVFESELYWERDPRTLDLLAKLGHLKQGNPRIVRHLPIRVTDDVSGHVVDQATIKCFVHGGTGLKPPIELITDDSGIAELPIHEGDGRVFFVISHPDHARFVSVIPRMIIEASKSNLNARLKPGTVIGGRTVGPDGNPIDQVAITVVPHRPQHVKSEGLEFYESQKHFQYSAVSDVDGNWSIPGFPARVLSCMIRTQHLVNSRSHYQTFRFSTDLSDRQAPSSIADLLRKNLSLVLDEGIEIEGTVVDSNGNTVTGASIRILHPFHQKSRATATDSEGQFSLNVSPPSPITIVVEKPGYAMEVVGIPQTEREFPLRIEIQSGNDLVGRVIDSTGNSVHEASVHLVEVEGQQGFVGTVHTGPDGKFVWQSAPRRGIYSIHSQDERMLVGTIELGADKTIQEVQLTSRTKE